MSLIGGLVDSHHEMELNPSTQRVTSNWFVRHIGVIVLLAGSAVGLFIVL